MSQICLKDHHIYGEKYDHPKCSEQTNAMNKLKAEKFTIFKWISMVTLSKCNKQPLRLNYREQLSLESINDL